MAQFLVELYVSHTDPAALERNAESARRAACALTREGTPVRYLRSILVPADETCFVLLQAHSVAAAGEVARRAGLRFDRLAEAVAAEETTTEPSPVSEATTD